MRRLILENIRKVLAEKVITKDRIFINRGIDADIEEIPLININSLSEGVSIFDESPRSYRRTLEVNIECLATGASGFESYEVLESMVEATEQTIEEDGFLNGLERTMMLNRIDYEFEPGGQLPVYSASMSYLVERVVSAQDFSKNCFDVLKTIAIDWKIPDNNDDDAIDAQDLCTDLDQ